MNPGRHVSLVRLLRLRDRLECHRYAPSLKSLAQEFNVCERTISRDLQVLEQVGALVPKWRRTA